MTLRTNRITLPDLVSVKAERREKAKTRETANRIAAAAERVNLETARKKEAVAEVKRRKENGRRIKADVANLKVDPIMGRSPTGQPIRVDGNSGPGRILALHQDIALLKTLGFTPAQIGLVSVNVGLGLSIAGGLAGVGE